MDTLAHGGNVTSNTALPPDSTEIGGMQLEYATHLGVPSLCLRQRAFSLAPWINRSYLGQ